LVGRIDFSRAVHPILERQFPRNSLGIMECIPKLGPLIHHAERNNGNINIRVNRIIQGSSSARAGDN
jgi:hypothetical protein